jgi:hypothetical protein
MKPIVLLVVLAAAATFAGEAVSVDTLEPPTEYNAHWNLFREHELRCDRVGLDVYGCNDCASLYYMGQPINLAGYDGVRMSINYMQEAADSGDYCVLYLGDEDHHYTLFHTFEGTDGPEYANFMLDDYYGVRDLHMYFVWVSDATGVDKGFRLYSIEITGINWGEGEYYENIFTWDSSSDVTGHQSIGVDWMLLHPNMNCLSFEYGADSDTQGWWAIDNVELLADGESVLPLQAGGYGVEDFESGGWYQDQHGLAGEWETDTDRTTGDMSGANWQCDSAAHPGWLYEAETLSPWVDISDANMITVEFDTWFHPVGPGEYASLGIYSSGSDEHLMWLEQFEDLDDWLTDEDGSDIVETSWGEIKASF